MGSLLMLVIYSVSAAVCIGIAWAAGRHSGWQDGQAECEAIKSEHRESIRRLRRTEQRLDYLAAESDQWQRRCQFLENRLIERAHLHLTREILAVPQPDGTREGDGVWRGGLWHPDTPVATANPNLHVMTPEDMSSPLSTSGPKEPPTPPNHKEVG